MPAAPLFERIHDYVTHYAAARPDQEALVMDPLRLTYRDVADQVDRFARALLAHGVRKGDRIAMMATPRPECYVAFLATASIGGIFLGLNPKYPPGELAYVFEDATPRLLLGFGADAEGDHREVLADLAAAAPSVEHTVVTGDGDGMAPWEAWLAEGTGVSGEAFVTARNAVAPADPALIVYTSGSTGRPKGAVLLHRGLAKCGAYSFASRPTEPSRILCNLPVNHVGYMSDICGYGLAGGGTIFFMERFDPDGILALIEREKLTAWGQVPTMFQMTVSRPAFATADLSSLQRIIWSGAAAPRELIETLAATGARLNTSYGLTETVGSVTRADADASLDVLAETIGRPVPQCEVRIVHPDGMPVQPGEEGEIQMRADYVMQGYWNRPEATAETIDADGWLHTGDVALLREDGNLTFRGRLSGMFKSGGENVYPREVELCLEGHPHVAMAAVFGVPDPLYSEVGQAHVMQVPGTTPNPEDLRAFCKARLANFKVPKTIVVHETLPLLPVGKVDKVTLKRRALADAQSE